VAASVAAARGLTILFARIFNLIGPGAPTSLLPGSLALQLAAVALAQQGPKIRMGPLTTIRDYVDVRDCAEALRRLCSLEFVGISVVNIASGRGTPISEVWDRLRRIALQRGGPPVDIESLPAFPANVSAYVGGTRRLQALGIECATPLQQSLEDLYDWALAALKPDDEDAVASR
jgi:GDP-4-dehydro-6-deoxy-D-mannose reductase